jgi:hypothetical protein
VLRFWISEVGQDALPAVDLDEDVVIGSGASARIRVPAHAAREAHVRITSAGGGARWTALAEVRVFAEEATEIGVRGRARRREEAGHAGGDGREAGRITQDAGTGGLHSTGSSAEIGSGVTFQLGEYRVRVAPAPVGSLAAPPQRTESLARELVRGLLGRGAAPMFEVERGPAPGVTRVLPPPAVTVVIGRGEEAGWIILDEDLSRAHAEVHRGWDGVTIRDLGSKNGTSIDGIRITERTPLRDGARIELGNVVLWFRDPAERHLRGEGTAAATPRRVPVRASASSAGAAPVTTASRWPFVIATGLAALAAAGLVWILAT